jgi:hypothetical protein
MANTRPVVHGLPWVYVGGGVATRDLPGHLVRTGTDALPALVEPHVAEQMREPREQVRGDAEPKREDMGKKV